MDLSPIASVHEPVQLNSVKEQDQLFFNFFGMYTADSLKQQKRK